MKTATTFRHLGLLRVVESRLRRGSIVDGDTYTYARSYACFVIERPGSKEENRAEWNRKYALFARPRKPVRASGSQTSSGGYVHRAVLQVR